MEYNTRLRKQSNQDSENKSEEKKLAYNKKPKYKIKVDDVREENEIYYITQRCYSCKVGEAKNNRIEIENINKQINELKLKLSNEKQINTSLEKMNNNYSKIIKNINIETANLKQEEKELELKTLTEDFHNLKEEYKNTTNIIKRKMKMMM